MSIMKKLAMLQAVALAVNFPTRAEIEWLNEGKPKIEIQPKPPTGTKEYFFNSPGEFSTTQMLKTEIVFKCYSINDKNAKRKFAKWQKTNGT